MKLVDKTTSPIQVSEPPNREVSQWVDGVSRALGRTDWFHDFDISNASGLLLAFRQTRPVIPLLSICLFVYLFIRIWIKDHPNRVWNNLNLKTYLYLKDNYSTPLPISPSSFPSVPILPPFHVLPMLQLKLMANCYIYTHIYYICTNI